MEDAGSSESAGCSGKFSDPSERGLVLENGVRAIFWSFLINSKKPIN